MTKISALREGEKDTVKSKRKRVADCVSDGMMTREMSIIENHN